MWLQHFSVMTPIRKYTVEFRVFPLIQFGQHISEGNKQGSNYKATITSPRYQEQMIIFTHDLSP